VVEALILTDQGRQYTSWRGFTDFEEELRRHGILHVKSRPHHPQSGNMEVLKPDEMLGPGDRLLLWLGDLPALLKGFFEQALRPGFAIGKAAPGRMWKKFLKGRSARIIVTMGMPAFFYRLYYRAHSVKSLKRNILDFCGVSPVRASLVGTVESEGARELWLAKVQAFGRAGR
jgi:hypothetical protein